MWLTIGSGECTIQYSRIQGGKIERCEGIGGLESQRKCTKERGSCISAAPTVGPRSERVGHGRNCYERKKKFLKDIDIDPRRVDVHLIGTYHLDLSGSGRHPIARVVGARWFIGHVGFQARGQLSNTLCNIQVENKGNK